MAGVLSQTKLHATQRPFSAFFHALFTGEWLAPDTVVHMMDIIDAPDEDVTLQAGDGLGVRNFVIDGESAYGHTGSVHGFSGTAMHNLEHGFTIVVLSNVSTIEQEHLFAEPQSVALQSW